MEAVLAILLPILAQLVKEILETKARQKAESKRSIDEALAKRDDAMLSAALDEQHSRVLDKVRSHSNAE